MNIPTLYMFASPTRIISCIRHPDQSFRVVTDETLPFRPTLICGPVVLIPAVFKEVKK